MTDDAMLSSFRLADSFLPVGTHTASYGLEQFVQAGRVENATDMELLLATYLQEQLGRADLVVLRAAHAAAREGTVARICAVDQRLTAVTLATEFRESAQRAGERLLSLQRDLSTSDVLDRYAERVDDGASPGNHAAVLGSVTGLAGVSERDACLVCCHGFVTELLGIAQRLLSLGHTDAQRILDELRPKMVAAVDESEDRSPKGMEPFTPLLDILAAEHERADRRLFVS